MLNLDDQNRWRESYRRLRPGWRPATERFAEEVRRHLATAERTLDLGCGRGGIVEQLAEDDPNIAGFDPDLASLIAHRLPDFPRAAAGEQLPCKADSFDLVYASWLLEHLARPQHSMAEIGRVLRPGGHFVFITPNGGHPLTWLNQLLSRLGRAQLALVQALYGRQTADTFPAYYRANSDARLEALATNSGLQVTKLLFIRDPTYLALSPTLFRLSTRFEALLPPQRRLHLVGTMQKVQ